MPASNISSFSLYPVTSDNDPKVQEAKERAVKDAKEELISRLNSGEFNNCPKTTIVGFYRDFYIKHYYKHYAMLIKQEQSLERIVYIENPNPAKKFTCRHAVGGFNRTNLYVRVDATNNEIIVRRFDYELFLNEDPITKEALLSKWPGPLDRQVERLRHHATDYIDTLYQQDSQRQIRYVTNDEQRKVILKLLKELLVRDGSIDTPYIARLLLKPEQTEIQEDEHEKRPLETLQKYLLLGKRSEAIEHAITRKIWDHAQCLAFLNEYQPSHMSVGSYDGKTLRNNTIVRLNDKFINSIEPGILNTIYRSLLNRILKHDPESANLVKCPNIGNDAHYFAMLSGNDCDMKFDQSNELFKLIHAVKQSMRPSTETNCHLITLGLTTLVKNKSDTKEDPSCRSDFSLDISDGDSDRRSSTSSYLSQRQTDTYAYRTAVISILDMMIINETWEFCLNLIKRTSGNASYYEYIMNLVPYKLVFAAKLLDYGFYEMSRNYLNSIRNALAQLDHLNLRKNSYYDWSTIAESANLMNHIIDMIQNPMPYDTFDSMFISPLSPVSHVQQALTKIHANTQAPTQSLVAPAIQAQVQNPAPQPVQQPNQMPRKPQASFMNQPQAAVPTTQFQQLSIQPPTMQSTQQSTQYAYQQSQYNIPPEFAEGVNDFNPEPESEQASNSYDASRRTSFDAPSIAPNFRPTPAMSNSSPVNTGMGYTEPRMTDSFDAFSPINQYDDLPKREASVNDSQNYQRFSGPPLPPPPPPVATNPTSPPNMSAQRIADSSSTSKPANDSSNNFKSDQPQTSNKQMTSSGSGDPQRAGILAGLAGSVIGLLPKNNSKQMILPDDSNRTIVYDNERKTWVDTTKGEDDQQDDFSAPPPKIPLPTAREQSSHPMKSSKHRYPRA